MKKPLPYFKWYPADAEIDEDFRAMNDTEIGFYLRCLNHSWTNGGIPASPTERQRILKVSKAYHDKVWPRVGRKFEPSPVDSERLVNSRQEQERAEALAKSKAAADSVRTRYDKPTNVATNVAKTKTLRSENVPLRALTRVESDYESDSESSEGKKEIDLVSTFDALYNRHPRKANRHMAQQYYVEAFTGIDDQATLAGEIDRVHRILCDSEQWTKSQGQFVPGLNKWLADRGWLVKVPEPEPAERVWTPEEIAEAERREVEEMQRLRARAAGKARPA